MGDLLDNLRAGGDLKKYTATIGGTSVVLVQSDEITVDGASRVVRDSFIQSFYDEGKSRNKASVESFVDEALLHGEFRLAHVVPTESKYGEGQLDTLLARLRKKENRDALPTPYAQNYGQKV